MISLVANISVEIPANVFVLSATLNFSMILFHDIYLAHRPIFGSKPAPEDAFLQNADFTAFQGVVTTGIREPDRFVHTMNDTF
ncbi:MAG: hypothetical protein GY874_06405 [Desulfobacteraceae bacterium]|nr:hypothetical protein [Desulfobacteraceae bacterium]